MKQELHLRSVEAFQHKVPLAWQAVEALRAVRWLTVRSPFVFPGARFGLKPISEKAIGYKAAKATRGGMFLMAGVRVSRRS